MSTQSFSMSSGGSSSRCVEPSRRDDGSYCQYSRLTVTIYYAWHPLAGQALGGKGHQPLPNGARAFVCVLPDGTTSLVPEWMTSREACARCQVVATPQVSVVALQELVGFLRTRCAKAPTIETDATPVQE